jgi:hypothetical protein
LIKWLERLVLDRCGRRLASRQIPLGGTPKQRSGAGRSSHSLDLRSSASIGGCIFRFGLLRFDPCAARATNPVDSESVEALNRALGDMPPDLWRLPATALMLNEAREPLINPEFFVVKFAVSLLPCSRSSDA